MLNNFTFYVYNDIIVIVYTYTYNEILERSISMNNVAEILSSFEKQLITILNSKEETKKSMRETDEALFEKYGSKDPEQVRLHKLFMQQPKSIKTGINLEINSSELADEVYKKICELIEQRAYPLEEVEWFRFLGTNTWHFGFTY